MGNQFPILLLPFFFAFCPSLPAHWYVVKETSSPPGFFEKFSIVNKGQAHTGLEVSLHIHDYVFGYWELDGKRLAGPGGLPIVHVRDFKPGELAILTARYFKAGEDIDSDGLPDWYEYRYFGNLGQDSTGDPDFDGLSNVYEFQYGLIPIVRDAIKDGGVSSRISPTLAFADKSLVKFVVYSEPRGIIEERSGFVPLGEEVSTGIPVQQHNDYRFAYWTLDGVRQAGEAGLAVHGVTAKVDKWAEFVAHYLPSGADQDADRVPDWYELNQFGDLSQSGLDDPDLDGFSNLLEVSRGQGAQIPDRPEDGGVSSRVSPSLTFAEKSLVPYTLASYPAGFVPETKGHVLPGESIKTPNLHGKKDRYYFTHWTINGERQSGVTQVANNHVERELEEATDFLAHYMEEDRDVDNDGIPDWFETNQLGSLDMKPGDDLDDDGFTIFQEQHFGMEPTVQDELWDGGISSRVSSSTLFYKRNPDPPALASAELDFLTRQLTLAFNKSIGQAPSLSKGHLEDKPAASGIPLHYAGDWEVADNRMVLTLSRGQILALRGISGVAGGDGTPLMLRLGKGFVQDIHGIPYPGADGIIVREILDTDGDGLDDAMELIPGTNPTLADSDNDGLGDKAELEYGTNPLDPADPAFSPYARQFLASHRPTDSPNSSSQALPPAPGQRRQIPALDILPVTGEDDSVSDRPVENPAQGFSP